MKTNAYFIMMVLLGSFGVLNALVVSGDAGASFAKNKSAEMCSNPLAAEVYICSGNVVKVVWADTGKGATFYVPDGRVINCPVVEAGKATAECVQFSIPNYCTQKVECEKKEQELPAGLAEEQINESKPVEKPADEEPGQTSQGGTSGETQTMENEPIVIGYTGGQVQKTEEKNWLDSPLIPAIVIAMLAILAAVYFIFKKTIRA